MAAEIGDYPDFSFVVDEVVAMEEPVFDPAPNILNSPARLPSMRSGLNPRPGNRVFACGNRAGRCRWSAGFLRDHPSPHTSFRRRSLLTSITLIGSPDPDAFDKRDSLAKSTSASHSEPPRARCCPDTSEAVTVTGLAPGGGARVAARLRLFHVTLQGVSAVRSTMTQRCNAAPCGVGCYGAPGALDAVTTTHNIPAGVLGAHNMCRGSELVRRPRVARYAQPGRAALAERLACSSPTHAIRAQSPAGSPDSRMWESCRTMPLVGGSSRVSPVSPPFYSGASPYSPQSPPSALKNSLSRADQISSLPLCMPYKIPSSNMAGYTFCQTPSTQVCGSVASAGCGVVTRPTSHQLGKPQLSRRSIIVLGPTISCADNNAGCTGFQHLGVDADSTPRCCGWFWWPVHGITVDTVGRRFLFFVPWTQPYRGVSPHCLGRSAGYVFEPPPRPVDAVTKGLGKAGLYSLVRGALVGVPSWAYAEKQRSLHFTCENLACRRSRRWVRVKCLTRPRQVTTARTTTDRGVKHTVLQAYTLQSAGVGEQTTLPLSILPSGQCIPRRPQSRSPGQEPRCRKGDNRGRVYHGPHSHWPGNESHCLAGAYPPVGNNRVVYHVAAERQCSLAVNCLPNIRDQHGKAEQENGQRRRLATQGTTISFISLLLSHRCIPHSELGRRVSRCQPLDRCNSTSAAHRSGVTPRTCPSTITPVTDTQDRPEYREYRSHRCVRRPTPPVQIETASGINIQMGTVQLRHKEIWQYGENPRWRVEICLDSAVLQVVEGDDVKSRGGTGSSLKKHAGQLQRPPFILHATRLVDPAGNRARFALVSAESPGNNTFFQSQGLGLVDLWAPATTFDSGLPLCHSGHATAILDSAMLKAILAARRTAILVLALAAAWRTSRSQNTVCNGAGSNCWTLSRQTSAFGQLGYRDMRWSKTPLAANYRTYMAAELMRQMRDRLIEGLAHHIEANARTKMAALLAANARTNVGNKLQTKIQDGVERK
ncbi:hypothetical protein PR048_011918 [Dryococelus australis]|uniref:Uncharacterized protein n=1 Tax=Dryococelus australis TaxID=614101 RepID=A0ABQ9HMV7_9NEOP|nr:hypothetical protein PR048_011918 [Dryococelus australis]